MCGSNVSWVQQPLPWRAVPLKPQLVSGQGRPRGKPVAYGRGSEEDRVFILSRGREGAVFTSGPYRWAQYRSRACTTNPFPRAANWIERHSEILTGSSDT